MTRAGSSGRPFPTATPRSTTCRARRPRRPTAKHWLGTDDTARDVLARVIYGFRLSVSFGLIVSVLTSIIGIVAGAVQGYFGGLVDLIFQRIMEIWSSTPSLYVIIIVGAIWQMSFCAVRRADGAVRLDGAGGAGAGGVPAGAELRIRARGQGAGGGRQGDHVPPSAAERHGLGHDDDALRGDRRDLARWPGSIISAMGCRPPTPRWASWRRRRSRTCRRRA